MKKTKQKQEVKFLDRIMNFFNRLGSQRELSAIRDSFALMLPIIVMGAVGILGTTFLFGGYGGTSTSILGWIAKAAGGINDLGDAKWEFTGAWSDVAMSGQKIFGVLNSATFDFFSIYIVVILGYIYARILKSETPIFGGLIALVVFMICGGIDSNFHGSNGLLPGIILTLIAVYLLTKLQKNKKLKIKMPHGIPPAVGRAFSNLIPVILVALIFGLINYLFWVSGYYGNVSILDRDGKIMVSSHDMSLIALFFKGISAPFLAFMSETSAGLGIMVVYLLFVSFFWFCGIHGSNLLNGIFYPIWMGLTISNTASITSYGSYDAALAADALTITNWAFIEQFAMITGSNITGMLILASILFSRNPQWHKVNSVAAPAAIFNINEPVVYGYPTMLNPILAIPTILSGVIAGIIAYLATYFGFMNIAYIYVPWTMPAPIGGFLTTGMDWRAIIVVLIIFVATFFLYLPFILLDNKMLSKKDIELAPSLANRIKAKIATKKNKKQESNK